MLKLVKPPKIAVLHLTYLFEKDPDCKPKSLPEECESAKDRDLLAKGKKIHSGDF